MKITKHIHSITMLFRKFRERIGDLKSSFVTIKNLMKSRNIKLNLTMVRNTLKIKNVRIIILSPFKWFKKTNRKNRLITLAGILLIIAPIAINTFLTRPKEVAAWWNESWSYRKKILISNTAGAQSNYTYGFSLGTLTSSQVKSDCSDVRVTDVNSNIITDPFWVDCTIATSPTVWVKFTTLPASSTVLYVYYGNNVAYNIMADPANIFTWAHTFAGTTIDTSKITQGGGLTTQSDYLQIVNNSGTWDT